MAWNWNQFNFFALESESISFFALELESYYRWGESVLGPYTVSVLSIASTNPSKQIPSDKIGDCRKINRVASQNDRFKKSSGSAYLCLILDTCQYFYGVMFWLMCTRNLEITLSLYTCVE